MVDIEVGDVVYSRAGHDKGGPYVVVATDGEFVYIADGDARRVENPKKKNVKHINRTNYKSEEIAELCKADAVENHMIRKALDKINRL